MKKYAALPLLALLLAALAVPAQADVTETEDFEQTAAVSLNGIVRVENTNGHINVESWNGDGVRISAVKKVRADSGDVRGILDEIEIEITESGGDLTINTRLPRLRGGWFGGGGSVSVSYDIQVPASVGLDLESTNGKVFVEGVDGNVELETTNGGIEVRELGGRLDAHTTNGKIEAVDVAGAVNAKTTNGSIYAEITGGTLDEDMELTTTNGSVTLELPPSAGVRLDARTSNGSVRSELPISAVTEKKTALSGDVNGGGPSVRIRTSNGSIRLREN